MQTAAMADMNELEHSKENFAPIRAGRDVSKLMEIASFAQKPNELQLKLRAERAYVCIFSVFIQFIVSGRAVFIFNPVQ